MDILLSVVVTVYNCGKYLNKCIDSIINACGEDAEIILVNDGSTDGSGAICDEYALKNPNIFAFHQENKGVTGARKKGFLHSKGKYITYVDCDDWVDDTIYSEMLEKAVEYDADIVICDIMKEAGTGRGFLPNLIEEGFYDKEKLKNSFYTRMLFDFSKCIPGIYPSLCNKLIKRELLEKTLFDVSNTFAFGEDALCSYPVMVDSEKIYVHKGFLYHYRQNEGSLTNKYDKEMLNKFIMLYDEFSRLFNKRGFDASTQIKGYIARYCVECIRKELILNTSISVRNRIKAVREYTDDARVKASFEELMNKCVDNKLKLKIGLICRNKFFALYLLFFAKEIILKYKGRWYEN